jgi:hypothetical protein
MSALPSGELMVPTHSKSHHWQHSQPKLTLGWDGLSNGQKSSSGQGSRLGWVRLG